MVSTTTLAAFEPIDWAVLVAYLAVMVAIGWVAGRRQTDRESFFLGSRKMPTWAVAMSVMATALSAATFIGVPQVAFTGDLTYLILNIGGITGAVIVAVLFIPAFYRAGTTTIYGYLGQRFGNPAMHGASAMFLFGRLLASGSRLFMAGIAFTVILHGELKPANLAEAIVILGAVGTAYTAVGGIKAVIWTDVLQIVIVVGAAVLSLVLLLDKIPLSLGEIAAALETSGKDGANKLEWLSYSTEPAAKYTLWTGTFAIVFMSVASYGVDQDLTQRMLTCKSAARGSVSVVTAIVANIPITVLFMVIGLLLFIFYQRPDLMGAAAPTDALDRAEKVYPQFLFNHLPTGLAGLAMAGLFAAAMSSVDSAINAMASTAVADLYVPWRKRRGLAVGDLEALKHSRVAVVVMGMLLTGFALGAVAVYDAESDTLIDFALGVMAFAYAGLLGVFLTALLTKRGNSFTAIAALAVGVLVIVMVRPYYCRGITGYWLDKPIVLAWPWWMPIGTAVSFAVCAVGRPIKVRCGETPCHD